jgi:hypothetical protein
MSLCPWHRPPDDVRCVSRPSAVVAGKADTVDAIVFWTRGSMALDSAICHMPLQLSWQWWHRWWYHVWSSHAFSSIVFLWSRRSSMIMRHLGNDLTNSFESGILRVIVCSAILGSHILHIWVGFSCNISKSLSFVAHQLMQHFLTGYWDAKGEGWDNIEEPWWADVTFSFFTGHLFNPMYFVYLINKVG